jgi:hypothetical protein
LKRIVAVVRRAGEGILEARFCAGAVAEPATIADVLDEDCHLL